jgi:hypothetical protein
MGNRGILHNVNGELTKKRWAHKSWVTCALNFKDYQRTPKERKANEYTELFFLDEATALAAGHRPCGFCRHKDFIRFVYAWARGNGNLLNVSVKEIDAQLHDDRVSRNREQITYPDFIDVLPDGVFVELSEAPGAAWLIWCDQLLRWQTDGYEERRAKPVGQMVNVLTPKSTVKAIAAGYRPHVHHHK